MASSNMSVAEGNVEIQHSQIPHAYICPISKSLMEDPVIASDNHTYNRADITFWVFQLGNLTSPVTRELLEEPILFRDNYTMKKAINEFLEDNRNKEHNQAYLDRLGGDLANLRMELAKCEKAKRDLILKSRDLLPAIDSIEDGGQIPLDSIIRKAISSTQGGAPRPLDCCLALTRLLDKCSDDGEVRTRSLKAISRIINIEEDGPHRVNRQRLGELGACQLVAEVTADWFHDLETAKAALLVLAQLALESSNRHRLRTAGACPRVAYGMKKYFSELAIQQAGLKGIANLAENHDNNQRILGEQMACVRVTKALETYGADPDIAFYGCKAIGNLAVGYDHNQRELEENGAGKLVLDAMLLYLSNLKIVTEGCKAIADLAEHQWVIVERLHLLGAVEVLERALFTHTEDVRMEYQGFRALALFVHPDRLDEVEERRKAIRIGGNSSSASFALGDIQDPEDAGEDVGETKEEEEMRKRYFAELSIQQVRLKKIANLAENRGYENQRVLKEEMACVRVTKALETYGSDPDIAFYGCKAIGNLSARCNHSQHELGERGAGKLVLDAMTLFKSNLKIVTEGCKAIGDLAVDQWVTRERLHLLDAVEALEGALLTHTEDARMEHQGFRALALFVHPDRLDEVEALRKELRAAHSSSASSAMGDIQDSNNAGDFEETKEEEECVGDQRFSSSSPCGPATSRFDNLNSSAPDSEEHGASDEEAVQANAEGPATLEDVSETPPSQEHVKGSRTIWSNLRLTFSGPSKVLQRGLVPGHAEDNPTQQGMPAADDDEPKVTVANMLTRASDLPFRRRRSEEPGSESEEEPEGFEESLMGAIEDEGKESEFRLDIRKSQDYTAGDACAGAPADSTSKEGGNGNVLQDSLVGLDRSPLSFAKLSRSKLRIQTSFGAEAGNDEDAREDILGWREAWGTDMTRDELLDLFEDEVINRTPSNASQSGLMSSSQPQLETGVTLLAAEPTMEITTGGQADESSIQGSGQLGLFIETEQPALGEVNINGVIETFRMIQDDVEFDALSDLTEASGIVPVKEGTSMSCCFPFRFSMPSLPRWKKTGQNNAGLSLPVATSRDEQQQPKQKRTRFNLSKLLRWGKGKKKPASASAKEESKEQEA